MRKMSYLTAVASHIPDSVQPPAAAIFNVEEAVITSWQLQGIDADRSPFPVDVIVAHQLQSDTLVD